MGHYKNHKKMAIQILKNVSHWMETSSFDYNIKDLQAVLKEAHKHYEAYVKLQEDDPSYKPQFEQKSYK
jgi:hypothetical protein